VPNFNFNHFGVFGGVTVKTLDGVKVGSTLDGVSITGHLVQGSGHGGLLLGGNGNDYIVGGAGPDVIVGGRGDDVLTGGGATVRGTDRGDTFVFSPGSGHDVITDFQGADRIDIAGYLRHHDNVTVSDGANGAVIDLGTGDTITLLGVSSSQLIQTHYGFEISQIVVG
jgi:Ca2+-binding RTX toxin-like protein